MTTVPKSTCNSQVITKGLLMRLSPESDQESSISELRDKVISSLINQGFTVERDGIVPPDPTNKASLRDLHLAAVRHKIERGDRLRPKEPFLIKRIAAGSEVKPDQVEPYLVEVMPNSRDAELFRYVSLHWSIPVSSGYGRRIRFLVLDRQNDKLIGIIGLGDPVFGLGVRDRWVSWDAGQRRNRLRHVLDAYVLGSVPPYSSLLCGKLVAMLAASSDVRRSFERKYRERAALISGLKGDARVAMITTTSALGRSSVYNRIVFKNRLLYKPVGYTAGSGEFHFANGLYQELFDFATEHCDPTAKNSKWGVGFRSRREVIRKSLKKLELPSRFQYHGVHRQVYVVPLAHNTRRFLRGDEDDLEHLSQDSDELFSKFRNRWLLPRAKRNESYKKFEPDSYLLWGKPKREYVLGSI